MLVRIHSGKNAYSLRCAKAAVAVIRCISRNLFYFPFFCILYFIGLRINGHSKHRSGHGYETASILSSDLETTTFLESDDDASSRITSTTGRHTNMSSTIDRGTLGKRKKVVRKDILLKQKTF